MSDNYVTPQWLTGSLGHFDLDPCSGPTQPWQHADEWCFGDWWPEYPEQGLAVDGLAIQWNGRIWCNPPYSNVKPWLAKMAEHGNGIAVVNVATSTRWWGKSVWGTADAVKFLDRRIPFWFYDDKERKKKNKGDIVVIQPTFRWIEADNPEKDSALIAWGSENVAALLALDHSDDPRLAGKTIILRGDHMQSDDMTMIPDVNATAQDYADSKIGILEVENAQLREMLETERTLHNETKRKEAWLRQELADARREPKRAPWWGRLWHPLCRRGGAQAAI